MSLSPVSTSRHNLPGRDSETYEVPTPNYIFYRIYAEDGAVPSKTPAPGDPFLGRIKARSVPPPHRDTAKAVKLTIARVENINDDTSTSLYLTPYNQSPMGDADKVTALNRIASGPGSTPQDPLAFVAKISGSALESDGRGGLENAAEPADTTPDSEIRYLYYLLYADNYELPSKVAFDPEEPSFGRIQTDSILPPHTPVTIKRRISRVERTPAISYADLFADISCNTPLKEEHISFLRTDYPGLSAKEPMAIVLTPLAPLRLAPLAIPDGRYLIKNRAADVYWYVGNNPIQTVYFSQSTIEIAKVGSYAKWDITHDTNGNISITSPYAPSSWVGARITGSTVPVPWRLIRADTSSQFYYLTTDVNNTSQDLQVPASQPGSSQNALGQMATLEEGNQWQMWEFIRV